MVAAATAGLALSLTGCSKTVDFLQYADVTFDGINGQATATVNVDYSKIGTDVFDKGKSQTDMDEARTEAAMMGEVNYEVTPSENLSNGDTVTLSVEISDYFQKEYKVTAKAASKEITVSGLQEPEMVDPFDAEETGTAVLGFWIKNVIIDSDGSVDVDGHANSITMTVYDSIDAFKKNEIDKSADSFDIYEYPVNWQ